jgi:hypothetical protein
LPAQQGEKSLLYKLALHAAGQHEIVDRNVVSPPAHDAETHGAVSPYLSRQRRTYFEQPAPATRAATSSRV